MHPVRLICLTVTHVIEKGFFEKYGINAGIGLQFTEFIDDGEKVLADYLDSLNRKQ